MIIKSQVVDYQYRATELENYNILGFFVDTYETKITKADREAEQLAGDARRGPGGPRNPRVRYLTSHPKSGTVQRIIRSPGHRNLPNFLGRWFPRNNDEEIYDFYCACVLMLLKPLRNLATDLKPSTESLTTAFETFFHSATPRARRALSGIQYFHKCESAAQKDSATHPPSKSSTDAQIRDDELDEDYISHEPGFSEEGLALLKKENLPVSEELYRHVAIELARHLGIFGNEQHDWRISQQSLQANAIEDDLAHISTWHNLLQSLVNEKSRASNIVSPDGESSGTGAMVESSVDLTLNTAAVLLQSASASEQALPAVDLDCLKPDQLRAYHIVIRHLDETRHGKDLPPLRMVLYGEAGTGKSRVIQTITEAFSIRGVGHMLVKTAYTGVAASLVNGKATHVIGSLSLRSKDEITDVAKKLQDFWRDFRYLIIDEYSMLSKSFLATLSRNISVGMEGSQGYRQGESFGGLNVILCGDLHQFPPVACGKRKPLYYPLWADDKLPFQVGPKIYEEFSTVVILK